MNRVAVVILNYNGRDYLRQFLPSVIQHSGQADVIVADNKSTDDSVLILEREFPQVTIIHIPSNLGYAGGYNYALRQVVAEFFVLLNSDVEVTDGWLNPIIATFDNHSEVAAIQPKILSFHHRAMFEYAGAGGGFIDSLGYPFCRGRLFSTLEPDRGQFNDQRPIFWASGACLFIRAQTFGSLGGFNEDFFAHMEEIDLCWRIQRAGQKVFYEGRSTVYHVGGGTLSASNPRKTYLNFRNGLSLLIYHLPFSQLLWKLPVRLALDWLAALQFLSSNWRDSLAIGKAHYHFLKRLRKDVEKRASLTDTLGAPKTTYDQLYSRLLIIDYYLLKRKLFSDLKWPNSPK
jgi:GT2 family glycosyltransferase